MTHGDFETGMYDDRASAEEAVRRLHELGYSSGEISVMMHDRTHAKEFSDANGAKVANDTMVGAAFGGGLGAVVAGLTATGSIAAIASTGGLAAPVVAGPLAAALTGLGAGALGGGILGSLVGIGIPEHRAKEYDRRIAAGGILVGVTPKPNERERLRDIFADERTRTPV